MTPRPRRYDGLSTATGACINKNCVSVKLSGNVGASIRMGARLAGIFKLRATFDAVCQASGGYELCDNLTSGALPEDYECKVNSFISTE